MLQPADFGFWLGAQLKQAAIAQQPGPNFNPLAMSMGGRTSVAPTQSRQQPWQQPPQKLQPQFQQQLRKQFETGVGNVFGAGAQKTMNNVNNALDTFNRSRPPVQQSGNI